jgi:hypothetical protein
MTVALEQMADRERREMGIGLAIADPESCATPKSMCIQDSELLERKVTVGYTNISGDLSLT